jgi:membrane fusion protein (multidrug efflux system)
MKKVLALLLFMFLFGGLIVYRWHEKETAESGAPALEVLPVETVHLKNVTFEDRVSFAADIEPEEKAAVVCKVPGKTVLRVFVSEGDSVKEGDPLAIVDDSLLRQQILQAEAVLGRALSYSSVVAADFERISALYGEQVVSRREFDRARGEARMAARQVQEARAALNQLKIMLGYHTITAPISGVVLTRHIDPGDTVSQSPAFILARREKVKVSGTVPERLIPRVKEGQKAMVTVDAFPGKQFEAAVSRVHPSLDPVTRTGKVDVLLSAEDSLLPGMYARVAILTGVREGVGLPLEAVGRMAGTGESVCFVVSEGVARLRVIKTGAERENYLEVLSGLENDEAVIASRSEKLRDGTPVKAAEK